MESSEVINRQLCKHLGEQCFEHKTHQTEQAGKGRVAGTECEQAKVPDGLGGIAMAGLPRCGAL